MQKAAEQGSWWINSYAHAWQMISCTTPRRAKTIFGLLSHTNVHQRVNQPNVAKQLRVQLCCFLCIRQLCLISFLAASCKGRYEHTTTIHVMHSAALDMSLYPTYRPINTRMDSVLSLFVIRHFWVHHKGAEIAVATCVIFVEAQSRRKQSKNLLCSYLSFI